MMVWWRQISQRTEELGGEQRKEKEGDGRWLRALTAGTWLPGTPAPACERHRSSCASAHEGGENGQRPLAASKLTAYCRQASVAGPLKRAAHVLRPPRWHCHAAWRPRRMGNGPAVNNLTSSGVYFPRLQVHGPDWHGTTS